MSILRSLLKNTLFLTVGQTVSKILGMVFLALFARAVGPSGLGKLAYADSLIAMFMILPAFGFDLLLVRETAKSKDHAIDFIGNTLTIKLFLSFLASFLVFCFSILRGYDYGTIQIILILSISSILISALSTFYSVFRAHERMEIEALLTVQNSVVRVAFGIAAIQIGFKLFGIIFALLAGDILSFLIGLVVIKRTRIQIRLNFQLNMIRQIVITAVPFGLLSLIDIVFLNTHNLIIGKLGGETAVAYFAAANKLFAILLLIPSMFMNSLFPVMSRLAVSSNESLRATYSKSFSYMLMVAFPVAIGGYLVSDQIILFIYGAQFQNSILVFKILVWAIMFTFVGFVNGATLNAIGKEKLFACIMGSATFVNIFLDYILIKKFGYIGACYAILIMTGLGFFIYSIICHWKLRILPDPYIIGKCLAASVVMGGGIIVLKQMTINPLLIIIFGVVVYSALVFLMEAFPKEDFRALRSVLAWRTIKESSAR